MHTRRDFLIRASGILVCAPSIVSAQNLMTIRGIVLPTERHYFGYVERLYVHLHLAKIRMLQNAGMSAHQIAGELNRSGSRAINNIPWDAGSVLGVIRRDRLIRREDLFTRIERPSVQRG